MRKITISLAVSLLVATGAFAGDKYRIFLGAYSGPTVDELVRDVTPKLKGVEGISDVIAERGAIRPLYTLMSMKRVRALLRHYFQLLKRRVVSVMLTA